MTRHTVQRRQRGYVLQDFVLALGLTLLIGAILFAPTVGLKDRMRLQRTADVITTVQSTIKGNYQNPGTYTALTTAVIADYLPADMKSGGAIPLPFGGTLTVGPAAWGSETDAAYVLNATQLPYGVCNQLVLKLAPVFHIVAVGTRVAKSTLDADVTLQQASTTCGTSGRVTLTLTSL